MSADPISSLTDFLEALQNSAPTIGERTVRVDYRTVESAELVDDSIPDEDTLQEQIAEDALETTLPTSSLPEIMHFEDGSRMPVAAVDCGIVRLGETEDGLIIALRASLVTDIDGTSRVQIFRTGPIYLLHSQKARTLFEIGSQLGKPDFYVEADNLSSNSPVIGRIKAGVADDAHQFGDRFRNWFERIIQLEAMKSVTNGIVLLDGALTLRTRDTPSVFLERLAEVAKNNRNALVAISKQSRLVLRNRPIRFWLDDYPTEPCYRWLSPILKREGAERILGNMYVARFSPLAPAFRMDVNAPPGVLAEKIINDFYTSCFMRAGYPDILVRAHSHSYFTSPDVIQLQAQAGSTYRLLPKPEVQLTGIFAPFGGRFK